MPVTTIHRFIELISHKSHRKSLGTGPGQIIFLSPPCDRSYFLLTQYNLQVFQTSKREKSLFPLLSTAFPSNNPDGWKTFLQRNLRSRPGLMHASYRVSDFVMPSIFE